MFREIHLRVEDSKAESLVSFLKELDFVELEKKPKRKKPAKEGLKNSEKSHLPFFALCVDWEMDAEVLRKSGWKKRSEQW